MLDSGDMFLESNGIVEGQKEAVAARADLFIKAYNKSGVAAYGLGDRDLSALGVEGLKALAKKAQFPFLNANVVDKDGKPVFTPTLVVEVAGFKVGVFGIVTGGAEFPEKEQYKLKDPTEATKAAVADLGNQGVDAIVMLAHLDRPDADAIVKAVPGIDVVLGGQSMGSSQGLDPVGAGFWAEAGQKGKFLNIITLNLSAKGHKAFVVREAAAKLKAEVAELDDRIRRYSKLQNAPSVPGTRTADPGRFKGVVESMLKHRATLEEKAAKLAKVPEDAPFLSFTAVPMNKALRDDTEVAGWVTEYETKYPPAGHGVTRPVPGQPVQLKPGMDASSMRKLRPVVKPSGQSTPPAGK